MFTLSSAPNSPVFAELNVTLHVGGQRFPVEPMSSAAFPEGAGLALDQIRVAVERLHAVRIAGERPLAKAKLGMWAAPDPFEHAEPAAVWAMLRDGGGRRGGVPRG